MSPPPTREATEAAQGERTEQMARCTSRPPPEWRIHAFLGRNLEVGWRLMVLPRVNVFGTLNVVSKWAMQCEEFATLRLRREGTLIAVQNCKVVCRDFSCREPSRLHKNVEFGRWVCGDSAREGFRCPSSHDQLQELRREPPRTKPVVRGFTLWGLTAEVLWKGPDNWESGDWPRVTGDVRGQGHPWRAMTGNFQGWTT